MNSFISRLPLPPRNLSPNVTSHQHWSHRSKATAEYRMIAKGCFNRDKPRGWTANRVVIEMDYYCTRESDGYRPKDVQNAMASIKAAIDGMIDAGVAPNDSKKHVAWGALRLHSTARECDKTPMNHAVGDGCVVLTVTSV